ncbi:MAG TPA: YeeE/YedE family protein [Pseudomonas pachastrellae]|nr:YeeE/YedE family protein [Halopseudomonas pachastrellae]
MRGVFALLSGLLFGFGLLISGMANPAKVLGFLDLAGAWDPSLALVMAGAIAVAFLPMQWIQRRGITLRGEQAQLPTSRQIDRRLVIGSLLFGAGWGVAGFCPGPALVAASALIPQALLMVAAMLLGMWLFAQYDRRVNP